MGYTSDDLIASVKNKALVPTNQATFTTDQILEIANEEIQLGIVPLIKSARASYFVTYHDYDIVSGQIGYNIPSRAVGMTLEDVLIIDQNNGQQQYSIPILQPDQIPDRNDPYGFNAGVVGYIEGNQVKFDPTPSNFAGSRLRLKYTERRNVLVAAVDAGRIVSIDSGNNQVTLANVPNTFNTNVTYDFIRATPGFDNLEIDQTCTGISGTVFTFAELPDGLAIGDYLALAGESPIVQLPVEFHPALAQRIIVRILEALGDSEGVNIARTKLTELQTNALKLITPRVVGEAKKVINPYGPLSGGGRWRRWWNS